MNAIAQEYEEEMMQPVVPEITEQQSTEEEREVENLNGNRLPRLKNIMKKTKMAMTYRLRPGQEGLCRGQVGF
jgi:hypothetical protein